MLVPVAKERADSLLKAFEDGITGVLLPLDDEDVVLVISTAVDDQVRPEPPLVIFITIWSGRQQLLEVPVSAVVKVDSESLPPKLSTEALLQVNPETMYERQLMSLKGKQISVLGYDVTQRGRNSFQNRCSIRETIACHKVISAPKRSPWQ